MRTPHFSLLFTFTVLCSGLSVAIAQTAIKPPERRPGYWQTTMALGPRTMSTQMCTDAAFEKNSSVFGAGIADKNCTQHTVRPIPGGWAFNSTCTVPSGTDVSSGTVTGDFQTSYHLEMTIHPSSGPDRHTTMDGKWLGARPAGRVPGDIVLPGGRVMNTSKLGRPAQ
jgi:hypothetical protein